MRPLMGNATDLPPRMFLSRVFPLKHRSARRLEDLSATQFEEQGASLIHLRNSGGPRAGIALNRAKPLQIGVSHEQ